MKKAVIASAVLLLACVGGYFFLKLSKSNSDVGMKALGVNNDALVIQKLLKNTLIVSNQDAQLRLYFKSIGTYDFRSTLRPGIHVGEWYVKDDRFCEKSEFEVKWECFQKAEDLLTKKSSRTENGKLFLEWELIEGNALDK